MNNTEIILNFHGIGSPHHEVGAAERPYWISEAFFQEILNLLSRRQDAPPIVLTFDDGNKSDLSIAATALVARKLTGKFFILTGRFDNLHYLSLSDIKRLSSLGMEIGLHGRDHVDWRTIPLENLEAETAGAREVLALALGHPVKSVAIPFGAYNRRVIRALKGCGFETIYTSDGGATRADRQIHSRTSIRADMTLAVVNTILENRVSWQKKLRRWLSTTVRRHIL
jgi:peptidoglycan/xylan/chitin deacetylase (PgdA/CDA1 family)